MVGSRIARCRLIFCFLWNWGRAQYTLLNFLAEIILDNVNPMNADTTAPRSLADWAVRPKVAGTPLRSPHPAGHASFEGRH